MSFLSSHSQGITVVREEVATFLEERDGFASDIDNIFLTNGASEGVRFCMNTFLRDPADGHHDRMLTPIPQYPLYSALSTLFNSNLAPYYLDESDNWSCSIGSIESSIQTAKDENTTIRGIVVINPGNPTGQVMTEESMRAVIKLCMKENICLMADEVYQGMLVCC